MYEFATPVLTGDQFSPPSVDFSTPCPNVAAYMMLGAAGLTTMLFTGTLGKLTFLHELPASVDLKTPWPTVPPYGRWPVPAKIVLELEGLMRTVVMLRSASPLFF